MKKTAFITAAFLFAAGVSQAQTWTLDRAHSQVNFVVLHNSVSDIAGSFNSAEATLTSSKDDFSDATVELKADVGSIDTHSEQRNNHLKSEAFFDAAQFPTLTFKSTSFKKTGDKTYEVTGDLTLHGVTKKVVLTATLNGTIQTQQKKTVSGWKVTGIIKRSDFGINPKFPANVVSDEVRLDANAEFVKA